MDCKKGGRVLQRPVCCEDDVHWAVAGAHGDGVEDLGSEGQGNCGRREESKRCGHGGMRDTRGMEWGLPSWGGVHPFLEAVSSALLTKVS